MNKLEAGMYCKTKNGRIDKIFKANETYVKLESQMDTPYDYQYDKIQKSSYNIIDLIEVGDLLEIEYFSLRYDERVKRIFEVAYKDEKHILLHNQKCSFMLTNNEFINSDKELEPIIKSIVTHEQFEQIKYEVE